MSPAFQTRERRTQTNVIRRYKPDYLARLKADLAEAHAQEMDAREKDERKEAAAKGRWRAGKLAVFSAKTFVENAPALPAERRSCPLVLILLCTSRGRRTQSNAAKISSNGARTAEMLLSASQARGSREGRGEPVRGRVGRD